MNQGRKLGSTNNEKVPLSTLIERNDIKGMMLTGFTISNNKLRDDISTTLSPVAALLYTTILSHRNTVKQRCFPTINTLHKETGISERKITDLIGELCENGYLIVESGGSRYANEYYFPYEYFFDIDDHDLMKRYKCRNAFCKPVYEDTWEARREIRAKKKEFKLPNGIEEKLMQRENKYRGSRNTDNDFFGNDDLPF